MKIEMIELLHRIMASGIISDCLNHIPTGNCHCCEFDPVIGNWIGLLEGEEQFIKKGITDGWNIFKETDSGNAGIICKRDPSKCSNKPLDCMLYPFFPLSYDGEKMEILAGFPKCPIKSTFIENLGNFSFESLPEKSVAGHLKRVIAVGYTLHKEGYSNWMHNVGSNYKGYNVKVSIKANIKEIEDYIKSLNLN